MATFRSIIPSSASGRTPCQPKNRCKASWAETRSSKVSKETIPATCGSATMSRTTSRNTKLVGSFTPASDQPAVNSSVFGSLSSPNLHSYAPSMCTVQKCLELLTSRTGGSVLTLLRLRTKGIVLRGSHPAGSARTCIRAGAKSAVKAVIVGFVGASLTSSEPLSPGSPVNGPSLGLGASIRSDSTHKVRCTLRICVRCEAGTSIPSHGFCKC